MNNYQKKISVIAGAYNANKKNYISEALGSICNQTYKNWGMIICDDGSTDDTYEELVRWSKLDERISVIKNEKNMGLAYSLNHCLKYADGEYIARMDLDDISMPERFEKQIQYLESNKEVSFCGTVAELFDENGTWGVRNKKEFPHKEDFLYTSPFIHPTILARKEVFEKILYKVSRRTLRAEDYDLFMNAYAIGLVGINIQESLYRFRENNECYARRKYRERFFEMLVRFEGFMKLKMLPKGILYVIKPLIVGLIPQRILREWRREDTKI